MWQGNEDIADGLKARKAMEEAEVPSSYSLRTGELDSVWSSRVNSKR